MNRSFLKVNTRGCVVRNVFGSDLQNYFKKQMVISFINIPLHILGTPN